MADIGEQLIVYLKTQSGVTTHVGTGSAARILQQDGMKESGTRPAITITITDEQAVGHLGGDSDLRRTDVAIAGFADTIATRNLLASAIDAALPPSLAAIGMIPVCEVSQLQGRSDGDILANDASDQRIYMTTYAYRFWHYQP